MYKHCTTKEAAQRQRQLEQCLLDTMMTKRYADISVSDLCTQVGISRKSFYYYFGSKDGVLHALLDHTLLSFTEFVHSIENEEIQTYFFDAAQFFSYWKTQKPLLDVLQINNLDNQLLLRIFMHVQTEEYEFRRWLHANNTDCETEVVLFAVSGITSLILSWHHGGYQKSVQEMAATLDRLLTKPLIYPPETAWNEK